MRRSDGFSLIEVALALALTLIVSAGVFAVLRQANEAAIAQPEIADVQQRLRIASNAIFDDLLLAGAPAFGVGGQPLSATIATVLPFRTGPVQPDAPGTFSASTLTVVAAAEGTARTTIAQPLTPALLNVAVNAPAGCPVSGAVRDPACGLVPGASVLVFDASGAYDPFTVAGVAGNTLWLTHGGGGLGRTYASGSAVVQVKRTTYYLKRSTGQLMRYNGIASDAAVIDNVAALQFDYFGSVPGSDDLVHLSAADLTDGPWRPDAVDASRYDADLLRIRRVVVRLVLRTAVPQQHVPDVQISFDVAPRNLGGGT